MSRRGFTLIEVTIAVTLVGLIALGLILAMNIGLNAMQKSNNKLMHNRRVTGVEHILEEQVGGLIPVPGQCSGDPETPGPKTPFFQGEPEAMRFVSTYSLQESSRGIPKILEFRTAPGREGVGVRLIVNEIPYTGFRATSYFCVEKGQPLPDGTTPPVFTPIDIGSNSFVLADELSVCHFSFLRPPKPDEKEPQWVQQWGLDMFPLAIRIEIVPLRPDPGAIALLPLTIPVHVTRVPLGLYEQ